MDQLKKIILEKISAGDVATRPRWQFVLRTGATVSAMVFLGFTALFLVSFAGFIMHHTGALYAPLIGVKGFVPFFFSVPWLLVGLAVVCIALLEILARRFAFAYRTPILYTTLGIIGAVLVGTYALVEVHEHTREWAFRGEVPILGSMYQEYDRPGSPDVLVGMVTERMQPNLRIEDRDGRRIVVDISADTKLPRNRSIVQGDVIVVFGHEEWGEIDAFGIRFFSGAMPHKGAFPD